MSSVLRLTENLLTPPGMGIFTVHTARDKKNALHQRLYGTTAPEQVREKWLANFTALLKEKLPVTTFLGIPSDCGGGILRGANWGPLALRSIFTEPMHDLGDVRVIPHYLQDTLLSSEAIKASRQALYGDANSTLPVSPLSIAEYFLTELYQHAPHIRVFGLGGDHSVSYPLIKTYLQARKKQNKRCALIHFDAHTDLLPSRLGVDICFGSWAYHILPFLTSPSDLYQIGIRSSNHGQTYWEQTLGIHQVWCPIKNIDIVLDDLRHKGIQEAYISFDIDALNITEASATGTPEAGGLKTNDAIAIICSIKQHISIGGADLVEVAPYIHHPEITHPEPDTTLHTSMEIIKTICSL